VLLDRLWPLGLAVFFTLAVSNAALGKPVLTSAKWTPPEITVPLGYPESAGVCFWGLNSGWRKALAASPEAITEFYQFF
jgi:hypothetical protein